MRVRCSSSCRRPPERGRRRSRTRFANGFPECCSPSLTLRASHAGGGPRTRVLFRRSEFERLVKEDTFLEWAEVHGNLYGTSRAEIERAAEARGLIFDVDHQGARQIKSTEADAIAVFILPPSMPALLHRLRGRASDDEATVQARYTGALQEILHYGLFDYVLVNDVLEESIERLTSIFRAEECRRERSAHFAEELIAQGRGYGGVKPKS